MNRNGKRLTDEEMCVLAILKCSENLDLSLMEYSKIVDINGVQSLLMEQVYKDSDFIKYFLAMYEKMKPELKRIEKNRKKMRNGKLTKRRKK